MEDKKAKNKALEKVRKLKVFSQKGGGIFHGDEREVVHKGKMVYPHRNPITREIE